jgi:23S rRNA (uridine2552-2'-O)-methyltransferase
MGKFVLHDPFFKKAKEEGYRARSAYKLKEIQTKFRVFRRGDRVLDLGCAPGSWLQVVPEFIGQEGFAVGIDILPLPPLQRKQTVTFQRDVKNLDMASFLGELSMEAFDVVTCDIAPNLSGIRDVDNGNMEDIYDSVKRVLREGLREGGNFVFKSFFSGDFKTVITDLKTLFKQVSIFKPAASRKGSSEIYLVCTGKTGLGPSAGKTTDTTFQQGG